jgi:hypothetical protein
MESRSVAQREGPKPCIRSSKTGRKRAKREGEVKIEAEPLVPDEKETLGSKSNGVPAWAFLSLFSFAAHCCCRGIFKCISNERHAHFAFSPEREYVLLKIL